MSYFKIEGGQVLKRKNIRDSEVWESFCDESEFDVEKQKIKTPRPPKVVQPTNKEIYDLLLEIKAMLQGGS